MPTTAMTAPRVATPPTTRRRPRRTTRWSGRALVAVLAAIMVALAGPGALATMTGHHGVVESVASAADGCPKSGILHAACETAKAIADPKGAAADAASAGFKGIVKSMTDGMGKTIEMSVSWFIHIPTPKVNEWAPVAQIQSATLSIQLLCLVASIMIGGLRLILAKRSAVYGESEAMFYSLLRSLVGVWAFGAIMTALCAAVDRISNDILMYGTNNNPGQVVKNMLAMDKMAGYFGSGVMFIICVIGILGALLQAILLVVRQAMLAVIVSLMPIIACASGTSIGSNAYRNIIRWCIGLLLWKFVASLVYLAAFLLAGTKSTDPQQQFYGVTILLLSAAVLPMLMKLVSGGMAMAGGSGLAAATMAMGVIAAGGAVLAGGAGLAAGGAGKGASTAAQAGAKTSTSSSSSSGASSAGAGGKSGGPGGTPGGSGAGRNGSGASQAGAGARAGGTPAAGQADSKRTGASTAAQQSAGNRAGGQSTPTQASTPGTAARDGAASGTAAGPSHAAGGGDSAGTAQAGGTPTESSGGSAGGTGGVSGSSSRSDAMGHFSDAAGHLSGMAGQAGDLFSDTGAGAGNDPTHR